MPRMYWSLKACCTILPPLFLDFPTSVARCLHARNYARDPTSEKCNCVGENYPVILPKWRLPRHLWIFYMPQIYDMGSAALLPLRRKACWGYSNPEKSWRLRPGLNPRTWVLKGSTLPLDHRSRFGRIYYYGPVVFRCRRLPQKSRNFLTNWQSYHLSSRMGVSHSQLHYRCWNIPPLARLIRF